MKMLQFTILIIDNDDGFRSGLADFLRLYFNVLEAKSSSEAKDVLAAHLVHLAIVDIRLTNDNDENDISGLKLCDEIEPIVARMILTGYPEDWHIVREALNPQKNIRQQRSADGFYSKDADDPDYILDEIRRVLKSEFEVIPQQRIAIITSGGDSPGMNAAIWSITRTALNNNIEVMGVQDGYRGLIEDQMYKLTWDSVSDIMLEGGTILHTARPKEFRDVAVRKIAIDNILRKHITGLIVIGGDGSMNGARALYEDLQNAGGTLQTVAIPGTIDNDLFGTDMSLGAASATNAIVNQLRNMVKPAQALRRIFVVEVMGARCGYLALQSSLGIGADAVLIPEDIVEFDSQFSGGDQIARERVNLDKTVLNYKRRLGEVVERLRGAFSAGKNYGFVILAEGVHLSTKDYIEEMIKNGETISLLNMEYAQRQLDQEVRRWDVKYRPDVRAQALGYTVRGVPPCQFDVWLGALLGQASVGCFMEGKTNVMVGWSQEHGVIETSFSDVVEKSNKPPMEVLANRPKWHDLIMLQQSLTRPPRLDFN